MSNRNRIFKLLLATGRCLMLVVFILALNAQLSVSRAEEQERPFIIKWFGCFELDNLKMSIARVCTASFDEAALINKLANYNIPKEERGGYAKDIMDSGLPPDFIFRALKLVEKSEVKYWLDRKLDNFVKMYRETGTDSTFVAYLKPPHGMNPVIEEDEIRIEDGKLIIPISYGQYGTASLQGQQKMKAMVYMFAVKLTGPATTFELQDPLAGNEQLITEDILDCE